MKLLLNSPRIGLSVLVGVFSLTRLGVTQAQEGEPAVAGQAAAQPAGSPEKARALLDQVKKSELDRQIALKQKEIERLKEDKAKTERDQGGLQQTIDSTASLMSDSDANLKKLTTEIRRLEHELAVSEAWASAERLKMEGLRALSAAQSKSQSALARHAEEADARGRVQALELALLQEGNSVPREGSEEPPNSELAKARKALGVAAAKTQTEEHAAREAMKAATSKMSLAETKAAAAQRLADNDLTVPAGAGEKPRAKATAEKQPEKSTGESTLKKAQPTKAPAPVASVTRAVATPRPAPQRPRGLFGR